MPSRAQSARTVSGWSCMAAKCSGVRPGRRHRWDRRRASRGARPRRCLRAAAKNMGRDPRLSVTSVLAPGDGIRHIVHEAEVARREQRVGAALLQIRLARRAAIGSGAAITSSPRGGGGARGAVPRFLREPTVVAGWRAARAPSFVVPNSLARPSASSSSIARPPPRASFQQLSTAARKSSCPARPTSARRGHAPHDCPLVATRPGRLA